MPTTIRYYKIKEITSTMKIKRVTDKEFQKYGRIVHNIDFSELITALVTYTPTAENVVYEPSVRELENTPVFSEL